MFRTRRLRKHPVIRKLVQETNISTNDFIAPVFIEEGKNIKKEIKSMPGIFRYSIDRVDEEIDNLLFNDIKAIILFGIPSFKDEKGSSALSEESIISKSIYYIKNKYPEIYIISDLCFCEYTSHGHCGIIKNNDVDNDLTLEILKKQSIIHAKAGVDMIAPSGMMDGMVTSIRKELDSKGFYDIPIMSYSAKYASSFYGPFRDAADSSPIFGDRKSYQMNPANSKEALKEVKIDIEEGADIIMIKPAMAYLDIISEVKKITDLPIAAYNVSGEYSIIKAAGKMLWIDEDNVIFETLLSIKRAGANIIISYFAKDVKRILKKFSQ